MNNVERRTITNDFEVRAAGGFTTITGYASVFNSLSQNLGGFVEQVSPGAFKKTLLEADVRALFNHDPNYVLGRNKAGTLRMVEDGKGLAYEVDLPDTQQARDLAESMRRGDISQSSFGFRVIRDSWGVTEDDYPLRTLEEVALYDVSPVTYPAYTEASSALRSLAKMSNTDIATLVDAGAAGELRAYIMGEVPLQDMSKEIVLDEDPVEVPEQRGTSEDIDTALTIVSAETDEPDTVHLSSQEAQRRLRDAKAKELALRLRIASR